MSPPPEHGDPEAARAKAEAMVKAWTAAGIDGVALSNRDWALGTSFVRDLAAAHGLPVLAANLRCDGEPPFPGSRIVKKGGWRLGLAGVAAGPVPGCQVDDPRAALEREVRALGTVDVVVALIPDIEAGSFAVPGVDVWVVTRPAAPQPGPLVVGPTHRGKQLGKLTFQAAGPVDTWASAARAERAQADLRAAEERLARVLADAASTEAQRAFHTSRVEEARRAVPAPPGPGVGRVDEAAIELSRAIPDDPVAAGFVQEALAKMEARPALSVDVPWAVAAGPYAGAAACQGCHPAQHAQWVATPHAGAYLALVQDGHGRDPACVGCHVTGYRQAGGPVGVAEIGGFRDVQCEACHGPARDHAERPAQARPVRDPPLATCAACHDGDRDGGRFEPTSYRARVVHSLGP